MQGYAAGNSNLDISVAQNKLLFPSPATRPFQVSAEDTSLYYPHSWIHTGRISINWNIIRCHGRWKGMLKIIHLPHSDTFYFCSYFGGWSKWDGQPWLQGDREVTSFHIPRKRRSKNEWFSSYSFSKNICVYTLHPQHIHYMCWT